MMVLLLSCADNSERAGTCITLERWLRSQKLLGSMFNNRITARSTGVFHGLQIISSPNKPAVSVLGRAAHPYTN